MRRGLIGLAGAVLAVSGCGADPVSPLPIDVPIAASSAPAISPSSVATSSAVPEQPTATSRKPTGSRATTKATPRKTSASPRPQSCQGAVRYDIELANSEQLPRSLCFSAGAVLRLIGIGPGEVTVDDTSLASQHYEAGIVEIRLLRAGTLTVTVPRNSEPETITVVIH